VTIIGLLNVFFQCWVPDVSSIWFLPQFNPSKIIITKQEYNLMSTKYKKYRSFLLPKEIVDLLFLSAHVAPLSDNKESEIIVGLSVVNDILSKSNQKRKHEDYPFHFNDMASPYLKLKYGNDYKDYMHWLVMNNIVWKDDYHEGKATSYYLHYMSSYQDLNNRLIIENDFKSEELKEIRDTYCVRDSMIITLETLDIKGIYDNQKNRIYNDWYRIKVPITKTNKKFLTRDYDDDATYINNSPKHIKKMGSYYKKKLKIDYDGAMNHSINRYNKELGESKTEMEENSAYKRYSSRISSINGIYNGSLNKSLRFSRNKTNKRLDTNLTNMASDLRKFIVGYENMSYLDLSNSQPVLFNVMLNNYRNNASKANLMEIEEYLDATLTGKWYELLIEIFKVSYIKNNEESFQNARNKCKNIWMLIAYSKNESVKKYKSIFSKRFPFIQSVISEIKLNKYQQFAISLQIIESEIFIDEICKELVTQNIIPYTMHDGLLVPIEHEKQTLEIMSSILKNHLGRVPNIKIENCNSKI
jgi:hypothetical protein